MNYSAWIRYSPNSITSDFAEYQKKSRSKWESRASSMGMRFPLFDSLQDFRKSLDSAQVVDLTSNFDRKIHNRTTGMHDLEDIKELVSSYQRPRDVDRIVDGFNSNSKLPMPIILKGNNGYFIMAGNTRSSVAEVLGVKTKVLVVDLSIN